MDCTGITILLVDDDSGFRNGLASVLEDDGHQVLSYSSPGEIPSNGNLPPIHALISDYEMPGENGFSFVDRFHRSRPEVPVILVTAHHTSAVASQAAMRSFLRIVWKPLEYVEIHGLLHELANARPVSPPN